MYFSDLQAALIQTLRTRVRNGELTERSLAKLAGVSQPHIHNVLKGSRFLSIEMADQILQCLRISVLDLARGEDILDYDAQSVFSYLPVLKGRIGPSHLWPSEVERITRFPVKKSQVANMWHPVVAQLGADARMAPLFAEGDFGLLDQSYAARANISADHLYVVKWNARGLVRRLNRSGQTVYMSAVASGQSEYWERVPLEAGQLEFFVRARLTLISPEMEWADQP